MHLFAFLVNVNALVKARCQYSLHSTRYLVVILGEFLGKVYVQLVSRSKSLLHLYGKLQCLLLEVEGNRSRVTLLYRRTVHVIAADRCRCRPMACDTAAGTTRFRPTSLDPPPH
jgi:hypothetical protein